MHKSFRMFLHRVKESTAVSLFCLREHCASNASIIYANLPLFSFMITVMAQLPMNMFMSDRQNGTPATKIKLVRQRTKYRNKLCHFQICIQKMLSQID